MVRALHEVIRACMRVHVCEGGGGKQRLKEKGIEVNIRNFLVAILKSKNKQVKLILVLLFNPISPKY